MQSDQCDQNDIDSVTNSLKCASTAAVVQFQQNKVKYSTIKTYNRKTISRVVFKNYTGGKNEISVLT